MAREAAALQLLCHTQVSRAPITGATGVVDHSRRNVGGQPLEYDATHSLTGRRLRAPRASSTKAADVLPGSSCNGPTITGAAGAVN